MKQNKSWLQLCSKSVSSLKSKPSNAWSVNYSDIVSLNYSVEKKMRQNEAERTASMNAAAKCIVGYL